MKPQSVRLFDVFALGPFMMWYAARSGKMPLPARALLMVFGAGTIFYNGRNYLEARALELEAP